MSSCQFFWITGEAFYSTNDWIEQREYALIEPLWRARRPWIGALAGSDAATLARTAAVVRDRRHVADRGDVDARRLDRAQGRLAARTRPRNLDLERAHAVLGRLADGVLGGDLRRKRGRLAGALESHRPGGGPRDRVALRIGDGDHRIVERRVHVGDAGRDVLAFAAADSGRFFGHELVLQSRFRASIPEWVERISVTSSCRRSAWPCPCGCARWCACADRGPAAASGGEGLDRPRGPSGA